MSRPKLAELHTRWANRIAGLPGDDYVEDGPIGEDPKTYWSAPRRERIVFLLREPNSEDSNDMRQRVQSNASPTWRGVMALLVALARRPLPERLTRKALTLHMDLLAPVALINVKKLKGGGTADLLELGAHLHVAADLLREPERVSPILSSARDKAAGPATVPPTLSNGVGEPAVATRRAARGACPLPAASAHRSPGIPAKAAASVRLAAVDGCATGSAARQFVPATGLRHSGRVRREVRMRSTLLYRLIGDGSHIEVLFELGAEHVVVDNNGEVRTKCLYEDEVAEAAGIAAAVGAAGERHERHGERRGRHEIEVRVPGGLTRWVFECDEGFPHPLVRRMYLLAMVAICRSG